MREIAIVGMQLNIWQTSSRGDDHEAVVQVASQQRNGIAEVLLDANDHVEVEVLFERHLLIVVFSHNDLVEVLANGLELCEAGCRCRLCGFHGRCSK